MTDLTKPIEDEEATALSKCYRLLLAKAAERRARLAVTAVESEQEKELRDTDD